MNVVLSEAQSLGSGSQEVRCEAWSHGIGRPAFAIGRADELEVVEIELSRKVEGEVEVLVRDGHRRKVGAFVGGIVLVLHGFSRRRGGGVQRRLM